MNIRETRVLNQAIKYLVPYIIAESSEARLEVDLMHADRDVKLEEGAAEQLELQILQSVIAGTQDHKL
jgi:hypothetical protein